MLRAIAAFFTVCSLAVASQAQHQRYHDNFPYWYVGLSGQVAFVRDMDIGSTQIGGNGQTSFDTGFGLNASLGYRPYEAHGFLRGARFELEYGYRRNSFDTLSSPLLTGSFDGDLTGHSIMANLYYDFDTGGNFTPYIGGGLGAMFWDIESNTVAMEDESTQFAYQGMLGFYYTPETIPDTEWGIGYRYFATADPDFTTNAGNSLEHEYDSHNLEFLARFRF